MWAKCIGFLVCILALGAVAWTEKDIAGSSRNLNRHPPSVAYWRETPREQRLKQPRYVPPKDWVYNTKGGPVEGKINVHLVPHTHDDTGWQITVDQYFFSEVYYIIDTVVSRLHENPDRKFIYVEVGFFARWWDQQPQKKKDMTRKLVERGQLEFINGAWCMHDEASPDYVAMIDQTTRGHQFLLKNFGKHALPRGTWQVDPFGHSNTQGWLLGAESGYESVFWGRTDYQDLLARKNVSTTGKGFEWIWEGSQSLGASAQIFAGEIFGSSGKGGYSTWINYDGNGIQVQDDPRDHDYNVDQVVDQFVQSALEQASHTQTDDQMWACGTDFQYQNADHWYHNLDKIIHYVNQNGSVNAFYSTPSLYVDQKKKAGSTWEKRYDDVWPLANDANSYWTGYFTSRPALKRQVRIATHTLDAARQMEVLSGVTGADIEVPTTRPTSPPVGSSFTDSLEGMIGVTTHHDGMSGTERQDVADDYSMRMTEGMVETEAGISKSLQKLLGTDADIFHCNCNSDGAKDCLNVTMCAFTTSTDSFKVIAWNPLATESQEAQTVRIPVAGDKWSVKDASGKIVQAQAVPIDQRTHEIPLLYLNKYGLNAEEIAAKNAELANKATHALVFNIQPPPVGFSTYTARVADEPEAVVATQMDIPRDAAPFTVSNGVYELTFDPSTGMMTAITNVKSNMKTDLEISWGFYKSSEGGCTAGGLGCSDQSSGAYIFRPNSSTVYYPGPKTVPRLQVVKGPVVTEVYQTFSSWATHVVRLVAGASYVEVEWTAGPIPMGAIPEESGKKSLVGKEVIVKYKSGINSAGTFYTDANGREMVKRQLNARGPSYPADYKVHEPVAGNYYPVNNMIAVQDKSKNAQLVVVTDVTQGGASLASGEVEMMVHRRVQKDDSRGVQEPLNETMCGCNDIHAKPGNMGAHGREGDGGCDCEGLTVRGRHWLVFDTIENANAGRRQLIEQISFPATLTFAKSSAQMSTTTHSALESALPKNVRLMTVSNNYAEWNNGQTMVRFAHLYSIGEHPELSKPASFSMAELFSKGRMKIKSAVAMSVTGNQPIEDMDAKKFDWKTRDLTDGKVMDQIEENGKPFEKRFLFDPKDAKLTVTLRPMEVLTFFVTFEDASTPQSVVI